MTSFTSGAGTASFNVVPQSDGSHMGWRGQKRYTELPVANSSRVIVQQGGDDLERLDIQVLLANQTAFDALKALEGTTGTLGSYPATGIPDYTDVTFRQIGQPSDYVFGGGAIRTSAQFTRRRP